MIIYVLMFFTLVAIFTVILAIIGVILVRPSMKVHTGHSIREDIAESNMMPLSDGSYGVPTHRSKW